MQKDKLDIASKNQNVVNCIAKCDSNVDFQSNEVYVAFTCTTVALSILWHLFTNIWSIFSSFKFFL